MSTRTFGHIQRGENKKLRTLSGCSLAMALVYRILTWLGVTSSAIPTFCHPSSGQSTVSRLATNARKFVSFPFFHAARRESTMSLSSRRACSSASASWLACFSLVNASEGGVGPRRGGGRRGARLGGADGATPFEASPAVGILLQLPMAPLAFLPCLPPKIQP